MTAVCPRAVRVWATAGALLLLVPAAAWFLELRDPWYALGEPSPAGQGAYLGSRLLGLYALVFLWVQVLSGLLLHRWLASWPRERVLALHIPLGLSALLFAMAHPALFFLGMAQRSGKVEILHWLEPDFASGWYPSVLTLGRIALFVLLAGALAAGLRRLPALARANAWRWLHRLNLAAFALALAHSLAIGTEARSWTMLGLYGLIIVSTAWAAVDRLRSR